MNKYEAPLWQVNLPSGWIGEQEDEYVMLYDPQGPGTLQISALRSDEPLTAKDLRAMASDHTEAGALTEDVDLGDFTGFTLSYDAEDGFWQEWFLRAGSTLLFVTYNCDAEDEGKEDDLVEMVLNTLAAS